MTWERDIYHFNKTQLYPAYVERASNHTIVFISTTTHTTFIWYTKGERRKRAGNKSRHSMEWGNLKLCITFEGRKKRE